PPPSAPLFPTRRSSDLDSPERDELQEIADRINVGEWIRYRGVSAELDTLRQAAIEISSAKKKEEFLPSRKDTVFLLATDTDKGIDRKSTRLNSSHVKIS